MTRTLIIAVDGPAASGKGTLARLIARHYGLPCLDTGALYRATARDVLQAGGPLDDPAAAARAAAGIDAATLDDDLLRGREMGDAASVVARIPAVRAALLDYQRRFAGQPGGAVLDGRDIGTVVCPDADVKLFIVADTRVRARRRYLELAAKGLAASEEEIYEDLARRDERDRSRAASPLIPAADAHLLDTSNLDIEASYKAAIELIEAALGRGGKAL
jgi:cytidylate kinase